MPTFGSLFAGIGGIDLGHPAMTSFVGVPRIQSVSFEMSLIVDEDDKTLERFIQPEREVRVTLDTNRWPDKMKRGQAVDLDLYANGEAHRFIGRVKWRRLGTIVFVGQFV